MKTKIKFTVGAVWYLDSKGGLTTTKRFYNELQFKELTTDKGHYIAYLECGTGMMFSIEPRKKKEGYQVSIINDPSDMSGEFLFYCKTLHGALAILYKKLNTNLTALEDMCYVMMNEDES